MRLDGKRITVSDAKVLGKKLRPISSGWSWNKCIEADADAVNVVLCGSLSTYFNMDVGRQKCVVAGDMMMSDLWMV